MVSSVHNGLASTSMAYMFGWTHYVHQNEIQGRVHPEPSSKSFWKYETARPLNLNLPKYVDSYYSAGLVKIFGSNRKSL